MGTDRAKRLNEAFNYLRYSGLVATQKDVSDALGSSPSNISKALKGDERVLTDNFIVRFSEAFSEISSHWLLTGEGDMLASDQPREYDVETAQKLMEEGVELIPMYSEPFRAGNRGNDVGTEQGYISSYWAIPNLRATEVIQVTGDSMEPTIPRGTPVAVAPVYFRADEPLQLSFGDIFAISTRDPDDPSEYVTIRVKRLYKHDDKDKRLTTWIARSDNDKYEDFEIPISHVVGLWRVLAGVNYYA